MGGLSLPSRTAAGATGLAAQELTGDPDMDRMILAARDAQGVSRDVGPGSLTMPEYQAATEALGEWRNLPENTAYRRTGGGSGLFKVLSLAASVAVPFAAPALAGAIGASTAFGATIGSALTGAALGAGKAAIFGEDIGKGALLGGVSGGIGGYLQGAQAAPAGGDLGFTVPSAGAPTDALAAIDYAAGLPATGAGAGAAGAAGGLSIADIAAAIPSAGAPTNALAAIDYAAGLPLAGAGAAGGLSIDQIQAAIPGAGDPSAALSSIDYAAGLPAAGGAAAGAAAPMAGITPQELATIEGAIPSAGSPSAALSAANYAAAGPIGRAISDAGQYLGNVGASLVGNVTGAFGPDKVADLILRGAGLLAIDELAGGGDGSSALAGLSAEEQALVMDMRDELAKAQQEDENLFNERLRQAYALIGDVDYFDPEYFGLQSARRAQLQAARAKQAGLRGLTGEERAAEARRYDLETGRSAGTAYDVGYGTGVEARTRARQAGIEALPGSYPSRLSDYTALANIYGGGADTAARNALARRQNIAGLFGGLFGRQPEEDTNPQTART